MAQEGRVRWNLAEEYEFSTSANCLSGWEIMSKANYYRQLAEEAAARAEWCQKKLSFERKRHKALKDLAANEDWLDGKVSPLSKTEGRAEIKRLSRPVSSTVREVSG
jgi:hypothetical protein